MLFFNFQSYPIYRIHINNYYNYINKVTYSQVKSYQGLKMVLDAALLNTQCYKVRIKGKVEQFREWSSALPNTSV